MRSRTRSPRVEPVAKASITIGNEVRSVFIRRLSTGGAMVECEEPIEEGTDVRFSCAVTGEVVGVVAWTIGARVGIVFERPVSLR
jgi:hypothetical protein